MNDILFKAADTANFDDITALFNYYILNSTAIAFYDALEKSEIISHFELEKPTTYVYCIYQKSEFCGFCLLRQYSSKPGYIYTHEITIYLKNDFTRKGIGRMAVDFLESVAKQKGIRTIVAGISSENIGSIKLFEKCNYTKCGHFKNMTIKFNRFQDNLYYQKIL
jgi:L-amino acid N-acyltransferase YncA